MKQYFNFNLTNQNVNFLSHFKCSEAIEYGVKFGTPAEKKSAYENHRNLVGHMN